MSPMIDLILAHARDYRKDEEYPCR